jgi:error-prone DNA polymerase
MRERGYEAQFAKRIFNQIKGFGEYGFPESHAASFALLVYVSAWMKCHEPAAFFCALLNSQPMGFYAPAQLLRAARAQNVVVKAVDVTCSAYDSTLEPAVDGNPAIRLGLHVIKGLSEAGVERLLQARRERAFEDAEDLARRARLDAKDLGALAAGNALKVFASNRFRARWAVAGIEKAKPLLNGVRIPEATPMLKAPREGEDIVADYRHLGFSMGRHPLALLRERLAAEGIRPAGDVKTMTNGARVHAAGLVITRQRPQSASGVTFVTVEDETGYLNLVIWEKLAERERRVLLSASLLGVRGRVQQESGVLHIIAEALFDHSVLLGGLTSRSRNFR